MKKYKFDNIEKENPMDILSKTYLIDGKGEFNKNIKVVVDTDKVQDLTLKDFVNDGVNFIIENTKKSNNKNDTDGDYVTIGSSGNYAQIGSSGNYAQIGSSGNYAQIVSSGNYVKIGSSGDFTKIGSSGDFTKIGSSGYYAKIGSSGDYAQIGSSGDYAQIGSSGDYAQIGSSGYYAQIGSSGNYVKIGSSGDFTKIGSSGDYAQIGSSGYYAKIGSSGDYAQIGSSGDYAKINVTGKNSICFACGYNSIIKAKKETWISLAEYENKDNKWIPCYAKSAQIDNIEYVDYKGKILKENVYYTLVNKEFTPVIVADNLYIMVLLNKKRIQNYTIYKTQYLKDFKDNIKKFQFVAEIDGLTAHGETIEKAIKDVEFKRLKEMNLKKHAERIKEQGYFTAYDYRLITGACEYGTNRWLEENNFSWEDKKTIEEVLELTKGEYGHEILKEFVEEYFKTEEK